LTKKLDFINELNDLVNAAMVSGCSDPEIVKSLIYVAIEETFSKAMSDEVAIISLTSAFNAKLCDMIGLSDWGFDTDSKGSIQ
jgi:hypothetical protein